MIIISTIISTNLDQICNQSKNVDIKKIACYRHIYTRALVQKVKTYGQTTKFTLKNRGNYGLHRSFKENLKIATISIFEDKRKTRGRQEEDKRKTRGRQEEDKRKTRGRQEEDKRKTKRKTKGYEKDTICNKNDTE